MGQHVVVDEENLTSQGRSMEDIGREFQRAADQMKSRLQALEGGSEPPWGDDDLGEKFGIVYEGLRDGMQESMDSLAQRLGEMGKKLAAMASNHAANEDSTTGGFDSLGGRTDAVGGQIRALHHPSR
ncbi:hypothetical protein [Kitasatospora camelliae]|uniref:WXG100 family type VII secretion target n=1 Tax=Kitasatospora camelliae TaxID=3156397 RepID=A0AAU8JXD8_9ACTN